MIASPETLEVDSPITTASAPKGVEANPPDAADENLYLNGRPTMKDFIRYVRSHAVHPPGEGMLVYPGEAAGVQGTIPSIRLKWIREGVEDYEYVELLKKQRRGDWALSLVRQVATDFQNWSDDPAMLERVRRTMAEALSKH